MLKKILTSPACISAASALKRFHEDQYALAVANYILGGGGTSRLFAEIRSRLGLAYVVGSFYTKPLGPGMIGIGCQTKAESTVETIRAIKKEMKKLTEKPPTEEEIRLAKDAIVNAFVFEFDSTEQIVGQQMSLEIKGYEQDFLKKFPGNIEAVTPADVFRVSQKYFSLDGLNIVVVGDQSKFGESLDVLGEVTPLPLDNID